MMMAMRCDVHVDGNSDREARRDRGGGDHQRATTDGKWRRLGEHRQRHTTSLSNVWTAVEATIEHG
jgi:hypothetical protein